MLCDNLRYKCFVKEKMIRKVKIDIFMHTFVYACINVKEHHKATATTATNIIVLVVVFSSIYVIKPFLLEFTLEFPNSNEAKLL